jgi:pyruvate dehydrogenase E2 component (dihydrolipoamide acetyltransferase)
MPIHITMPRLSDTMEEGTLVKWRVKLGDHVKAGQVLADVETDKATMELQNFDDGTVAQLAVKEGQVMKVGGLILTLAKPGESVESAAAATPAAGSAAAPAPAENAPAAAATATDESTGEALTLPSGQRVSPLARKLAEENGVDLATIKGTGPDGRIIKRDVLSGKDAPAQSAPGASPAKPAAKPAPTVLSGVAPVPTGPVNLQSKLIPLSGMRKTIAKRLIESKTTIPHFTVTVTVATDALSSLRNTLNDQLKSQGVKLSVNDFVVRGVALALLQHPLLNSSWSDEGIKQHGTVNVGIAVALPQERGGGLVVPVLRDVQNQGLRTISAQTKSLAEKARNTGLTPAEMDGGTFTISNLGMLGVDHFEAIINPPQVAILAVGAAIKKPVVRGDAIVIGQEMSLTLSADHRVVDGAMAAEYLATLKQLLENPAALLV